MTEPAGPDSSGRRRVLARLLMALAAVIVALSLLLATGATIRGQDPVCEQWPPFSQVVESAGDVVRVKVTESVDGVATSARTVDVIRGQSPSHWNLRRLDPGKPLGHDCDGPPPLYADKGDRLVLAIDGTLRARKGRVDSVALVTRKPRHPNRSELERLTRVQAEAIDDARPLDALPLDVEPPRPTPGLGERVGEALSDTVRSLISPIGDRLLVPWPERPPAPLPPGADRLVLLVRGPAPPHPIGQVGACPQALWQGRLEVVDEALVPVRGRVQVEWPRGFSARMLDDMAELVAPDGSVIAPAGELIRAGGGYSDDPPVFHACEVGDTYYPPAS